MAPQELQAGPVTLLQLFKGERQYVSPLFQRQYVWTSKEIDTLWANIDEILEGSESTRFLGAIVLEIKATGLAFQPDSMWIVDGQQRLTTLYMTLLAIGLEAEKAHANDLAKQVFEQYIFNQGGQYKQRPKLYPTLLDYQQFNHLFDGLTTVSPKLEFDFGVPDGTLAKANKQIRKAITDRCYTSKKFDEPRATLLVATILEKLKFVQILLGDAEDPHQVFDSLNAQGVRLENKDLIRNLVFQRLAGNPTAAETLYRTKWLPLEQTLNARFDGYFFPFALIHKSSVTKSTLLSSLRDRWKDWNPESIVDDLQVFVPFYNSLTSPDEKARQGYVDSEEIFDSLICLFEMPVPTTTYPFVLRLLYEYSQGNIDEPAVTRNLRLIESFLVRRAFAGFEPTGLHAVFKSLWNETNGNPSGFIETIDHNPTIVFPNDDEFKEHVINKPLYQRKLAHYVLWQYERALPGGDATPKVDFSIDHVMPQTLTPSWEATINAESHARLKDTWANLVPLTLPANSEKGQMAWPQIRQYFMTETLFKTTKRLVMEYERWDEPTIKERAERLAAWAVLRWPKKS